MNSKNNVDSSCLLNKIENIKLIIKNNQFFIQYNCENDHNEEGSLEDFLENNKNFVCEICKKMWFFKFGYFYFLQTSFML